MRPRWLLLLLLALGAVLGASSSSSAAPAVDKTVKIVDFKYRPATVTVKQGARIRWDNRDFANHTVTVKNGRRGLDNLGGDSKGTLTFSKPGTYRYICDFHPSMHGVVKVTRR